MSRTTVRVTSRGRSTETFACQESQTLMQQYFDADGAFLAPVAGTASLYD